jgi:putative endonuclease
VYVLENPAGRFYVGQTADLPQRIAQHNDPSDRKMLHTKRLPGPWKLVYSAEHPTRAAAVHREREIKAMKSARWIRERLLGRPTAPDAPGC